MFAWLITAAVDYLRKQAIEEFYENKWKTNK